jgi:hypothetical protein
MKKEIIFLIAILVSACTFTNKNQNTQCEILCVNSTSLQKIIKLNQKWFDSWQWGKHTLKINDFQLIKADTVNIEWENINEAECVYLNKNFEPLFVELNQFCIDLYSYSTFIEKYDNDIFVAFDVDTKVYVMDKLNKRKCEIISTGTMERIEDAVWFDSNTIILFGYYDENQNAHTPLLWLINFKNKNEFIYKYTHSFNDIRNAYFFTKFPNYKLME